MKDTHVPRKTNLTLMQYHASVVHLVQAQPSVLTPAMACESWGRGYLAACDAIEGKLEQLRRRL